MSERATIIIENDVKCEFPVVKATIGEDAIDIASLYKQTDMFTYDPGFVSTASCKSSITYIDGDKGILLHRGYDIADLAKNTTFTSLFYALLFGDLPIESEKKNFEAKLLASLTIEQGIKDLIHSFSKDDHPMSIMMAATAMLAGKCGSRYNPYDIPSIDETAIDAVGKVAIIAAYVFRFTSGLGETKYRVDSGRSFEENIVNLIFDGTDIVHHQDVLSSTFNQILILHADHEQNASTSSVRLVASTDVNIYASIAAGFAALWGPLHGGANEAVINMLNKIGKLENISSFIEMTKDKTSNVRLMGFGHRVYKNYDPRATVLKSSCDKVLSVISSKSQNERLEIAKKLEEIALSDPYFIERKLFPNVDFYSGIIYTALGFKSNFFTVIFGMARTAGWASQIKEAMMDENKRISRPRQVYVGEIDRKVLI